MNGGDLALLVGTAVAKAAQSRPVNMNPAHQEDENLDMPGKPVGFADAGGDLERQARAGNAAAQAALIERAMKRA